MLGRLSKLKFHRFSYFESSYFSFSTQIKYELDTNLFVAKYEIPNDKPYRQLLLADGKYHLLFIQSETNTNCYISFNETDHLYVSIFFMYLFYVE